MALKLSITEQIGMWLAKADASDSEAEKELFYTRAQEVATRNSIDMAVARRAVAKGQKRETPIQKHVVLGKAGQRALSWYVELYLAITHANDLRVTIAPNSTYVNLYGFPSDIEVSESIYVSAVASMAQLADAYLKAGDYKQDVKPRRVKIRTENPNAGEWGSWYTDDGKYHSGYQPKYLYEWTYVTKPVSGMTARQNFYQGFVQKIESRLMEAKRTVEATKLPVEQVAILAAANAPEMSTALVLADKKEEVDEFYNSRFGGRRLRGWNGSRSPVYSGAANAAGGRAAASVSLGQGNTALGGQSKALGR